MSTWSATLGLASVLSALLFGGAVSRPASTFHGETPSAEMVRPLAFRHRDHVRSRWGSRNEAEYPRDCRGCHSYGQNSTRDPQVTCEKCHVNQSLSLNIPQTKPAFRRDLNSLRESGRPFTHYAHGKIDCQRCHDRVSGRPDDPGESDEMKMKRGWHTCLECHDPKSTSGPAADRATDARAVAAFVGALNTFYLSQPTSQPGRFDHREHLISPNDPITSCLKCHQQLTKLPGDKIGEGTIDQSACAECHITKSASQPVLAQINSKPYESPLDGTFPHENHCSEAALKDSRIGSQGCRACHTVSDGGRTYGLNETFKRDGYASCNQCHYHQQPDWQLLDANGKDDHGQVQSCAPCHEFGSGPMDSTRPRVEVTREDPNRFVMLSQDHPFITVKGGRVEEAESCRECHRAKIEGGLPSRLGEKPFSHDTHLPKNPTQQDCEKCHASVANSGNAASLKNYELDSCEECHKGAPLRAVFETSEPGGKPLVNAKQVPRFPHDLHLKSDKVNGCADCHVATQNGVATVGTLPKAMDCSQCHNHGEAAAITGNKGPAYVASCAKCHGDNGPVIGVPVMDTRVLVSGLTGAQHHPLPTEKACNECHLPGEPIIEARPAPYVFADLRYPKRRFHNSNPGTKTTGRCNDCHWHEIIANRLTGTSLKKPSAMQVKDQLAGYPGVGR